MTVPMVAWMRFRGHGWRPSNEMAASMFVPTFAVIVLMGGSGSSTTSVEHLAMFPAMLLRVDEYAGRHRHRLAASQ